MIRDAWELLKRWNKPLLLMFSLPFVFILLYIISQQAIAAQDNESVFSTHWMGFSGFRKELSKEGNIKILLNLSELGEFGNGTVLVLVEPEQAIHPESVIAYSQRGGSVFVAGNPVNIKPILDEFGVETSKTPVIDKTNYFMREDAPLAKFSINGFSGTAAFKHTYAVFKADSAELLKSSRNSWLDVDRDGILTPNDTKSSFVLALSSSYSNSTFVLLGDGVLFSNDMLTESDNILFLHALFSEFQKKDVIIIYDGNRSQASLPGTYLMSFKEKTTDPFFVLSILSTSTFLLLAVTRLGKSKQKTGITTKFSSLVDGVAEKGLTRREPAVWQVIQLTKRVERLTKTKRRMDTESILHENQRVIKNWTNISFNELNTAVEKTMRHLRVLEG